MTTVAVPTLTVAQVDISDLTTATVGGTGVFDVLLSTQIAHLDSLLSKNRITQNQYADLFMNLYTTSLNTAASFLLSRDKEALELNLLQAQIDGVVADTALKDYERTVKGPAELA